MCVVLDAVPRIAFDTAQKRSDLTSCAFNLNSTYYPEMWQAVYNGYKATCTLIIFEFLNSSVTFSSHSLTGRLPFDDGYFDHVHVYRIAWGISELKVSNIPLPC